MASSGKQLHWNPRQHAALQALDVPLYQLNTHVRHSVQVAGDTDNGVNSDDQLAAPEQQTHFYRLGPLALKHSQTLPVKLPRWLQDCCIWFDAQPIVVNTIEDKQPLDIEQCERLLQSADGKKQLWQQILHQLN